MRRLWLAFQLVLAAGVLYFVGRSVAHNWQAIRSADVALKLDPVSLAVSAGIVLAAYALLISAWRAVLLGWGQRIPYLEAARIWSLSNLARYVPGRVWQIAGMAAMATRAGVSPWAATGSAVVMQLLAIATGALVTGAAAPGAGHPWLIALTGTAAAVVAALLAWPPATGLLTRSLQRMTGKEYRVEHVTAYHLLMSAIVTTLSWCAYGLALYFFVGGILGAPLLSIGDAIGAFTASYLVGLLAIFTPGGLVVREGAIYALLVGPLGAPAAFAVAVGSRVLLTATEVLAAAITAGISVLPRRSAAPRSDPASPGPARTP